MTEKANIQKLKELLESNPNDDQRRAYLGTNVDQNIEVNEADAQRLIQISRHLNRILAQIFGNELEDELRTYLKGAEHLGEHE